MVASAIADEAKTARDDIKKDYDAKLTALDGLEKAQPALFQKIFETGAGKFKAAGKPVLPDFKRLMEDIRKEQEERYKKP
jgi:hypothetical protein